MDFYCASRAYECEFGLLSLGLVVGRTPEPLLGARGLPGVSLSSCMALTHPFHSEGGVCFAEAPRVRAWVAGSRQSCRESPLASARGPSGVPLAFYATLALPFRSEGGVEYARLPSMGASDGISGELLSGKSEWRPEPHSLGVG